MTARYLIVVSVTGHAHAWEWNPASGRSIGQTHSAIQWAEAKGELTRTESSNAHNRVERTSVVPREGIFGFFMRAFASPAAHDQAIVELTQEVAR